jgi:hypothetical protein
MQVHHALAAGLTVQPVDVLRHQQVDLPVRLESGECAMRCIGSCGAKVPPAHHTARPVALPHLRLFHERLELHGPGALPRSIPVAIVGYAGVGAHAGAGEDEQAGVRRDEL